MKDLENVLVENIELKHNAGQSQSARSFRLSDLSLIWGHRDPTDSEFQPPDERYLPQAYVLCAEN